METGRSTDGGGVRNWRVAGIAGSSGRKRPQRQGAHTRSGHLGGSAHLEGRRVVLSAASAMRSGCPIRPRRWLLGTGLVLRSRHRSGDGSLEYSAPHAPALQLVGPRWLTGPPPASGVSLTRRGQWRTDHWGADRQPALNAYGAYLATKRSDGPTALSTVSLDPPAPKVALPENEPATRLLPAASTAIPEASA